jgi:hypothetical protein
LLHEATRESAAKPEMIEWLEKQIRAGRVRAAGIGSEFHLLGNDANVFEPVYRVLQFESSVMHPNIRAISHASQRTPVTHGSLHQLVRMKELLKENQNVRGQVRDLLNADPETALAPFLLQLAAAENPEGIVLFSSSQAARISSTLQAFEQPRYDTTRSHAVAGLLKTLLESAELAGTGTSTGTSK